jgi:hypothetical protein
MPLSMLQNWRIRLNLFLGTGLLGRESRCGPTGIRSTSPRKPTGSLPRLLSRLEERIRVTPAPRRLRRLPTPVTGKDYLRLWSLFRHHRLQNGAETPWRLGRQAGCMDTLILACAIQGRASGHLGSRVAEDAWEAVAALADSLGQGTGLT